MTNEGLFLCVDEQSLTVSLSPISEELKRRLEDLYRVISYQLLVDIPIICLLAKDSGYPELYPSYHIVPESCWDTVELGSVIVHVNDAFAELALQKPRQQIALADFHTIFAMITDIDALRTFGDAHGLVIGASIC